LELKKKKLSRKQLEFSLKNDELFVELIGTNASILNDQLMVKNKKYNLKMGDKFQLLPNLFFFSVKKEGIDPMDADTEEDEPDKQKSPKRKLTNEDEENENIKKKKEEIVDIEKLMEEAKKEQEEKEKKEKENQRLLEEFLKQEELESKNYSGKKENDSRGEYA